MRLTILAACAALLALAAAPAQATQHPDDRYFDSRAPAVQQKVVKKVRRNVHKHIRHRGRNSVTKSVLASRLKYHRVAWQRQQMSLPMSVAFDRPSGPRPRAWCGWWLGQHLGLYDRKLWLARNWAAVGSRLVRAVPGAIVVWAHHVGKITAVRADGAIRVLSGNDGRAVRDRWRSARGVIAYRAL